MSTQNKDDILREIDKKLIEGHEYDGIQELDNDLPPWWKWLFYISIVFAITYGLMYHILERWPLQTAEYEQEMSLVQVKVASVTADNVTVLTDQVSLDAGKVIYDKLCTACHKPQGQGLIGPNFLDDYWIHGNTINDMFKIVTEGVIEKGMISYEKQLTPKERQDVLSYIIHLKETTAEMPADAKEPQGDLYE